jgi:S1-C subfamily serine protease
MNVKAKTLTILVAALAVVGAARAASIGPVIDEKKIEEITKSTAPSVVKVEARNGVRRIATGVVIDKDGTIVTTALISPRVESVRVTTADGKTYKAEFKGFDTQTGIAVIQVKDAVLAPIAMGRSGDLKPGAWIGVVGMSPENTPAVTQGIVSSTSPDKVRLNVWVVPGSSGAPVINAAGQMIGLLRGTYMDDQQVVFEFREQTTVGSGIVLNSGTAPSAGMALAIPVDLVSSVAADIKKSGRVERGWLGVSVGETEDGRVEIAQIDPKSPAETAKFKEGDIIVRIEGKELTTREGLSQEIRSRKPGQDVTIKIERDGKPLDIKVKLGEYTEDNARRELEVRFPQFFPQIIPRPSKPGRTLTIPPNIEPFRFEKRKYIGVSLQEMNPELAEAWGAKDGYGLLVAQLADDGSAKKAGVKVGDIILKADGRNVKTVGELSGLLQDKKKGDKIKLEIVRDRKALSFDVEVAEDAASGNVIIRESQEIPRMMEEQFRKSRDAYSNSFQESQAQSQLRLKQLNKELERMQESLKKDTPSPDLAKIMRRRGIYYRI